MIRQLFETIEKLRNYFRDSNKENDSLTKKFVWYKYNYLFVIMAIDNVPAITPQKNVVNKLLTLVAGNIVSRRIDLKYGI